MSQKPDPSQVQSVSSVGTQSQPVLSTEAGLSEASGTQDLSMETTAIANGDPEQATAETETEILEVPRKRQFLLPNWQWLGLLLIFLSGGVGFLATSVLLSFNGSNNCSALFLPLASATTRLYCAQIEAEKQTLASYLKAIRMVSGFSENHPLRADIDRNIEVWVSQIIALAEVEFQAGKLDEAIAMVRDIPEKAGFQAEIEAQITAWEDIWQEGEAILASLQRQLEAGDLSQAMRTVVQLSYLDNRYWATVKYDEAMAQIQLARKETEQLEGAYAALRRGGLENWLQAIAQASNISQDSYAYPQAQRLISDAREKIIDYTDNIIDERRWDDLLALCDRLPDQLNLDNVVVDWRILAQAGLKANQGTVKDLETALVQIQSIQPASAVYDQAQGLISRWQREIEDVAILEQAEELAQGGNIADYERAIAQLNRVPSGNPRYDEARQKIRQWRRQIEIAEDSPTLAYAKDLAATNRLQEAIAEARTIQSGRALYNEAQENIRQWRNTIERTEDQPIFDRAVALGQQKRFDEAIAVANQIAPNRVLYDEMQARVRSWRQEQTAINNLNRAYQVANGNSVSAWVEAINLTQEIPSSASQLRAEGKQAADQWSYRILSVAQSQANISIPQAIATARQIPRNTAAYDAAQTQINTWQRLTTPSPSPQTIDVPTNL
ncbi:hypothetical protein [Picosynechococcus sp. PCC 7117]|uniref:hypothetical protein n=1 Tax=Picosynechococcus sp. PCC 7117 TaxID=195498 RepID=UPI000AABFAF9|nr:hypothetical protein [Picosynechococcus sp. PCC 7117]